MYPAAFFDLDGTLVRPPSCELRHLAALWRAGYLGPRQLAAGLLFYPRWLWPYGRGVGRKNKAFLSGLAEAELRRHGAAWVEQHAASLLLPGAPALVDECRRPGCQRVLMTGTPDFIAAPIARYLGLDECIATRCASDGSHLLARPPSRHPYGQGKLAAALAWCAQRDIPLAQCTAYGDSAQDAWLLEAVAEPVAVNPDRRLRRLARARRWRIVDLD